MKKQSVCVTPPPEYNSILQIKTTFKKINPRNKLGVSIHSCYDYKFTNYNYNNYKKLSIERTIKFPPQGRQALFVTFVGRRTTKHLNVKIEGKVIFVIV